MAFRKRIPWQFIIPAKVILSRLPVRYGFWKRFSMFQHGGMDKAEYAYDVFRRHYDRAPLLKGASGFTALELGPGDSLFSALIAYAYGAASVYLVDQGAYASDDMEKYEAMRLFLAERQFPVPSPEICRTLGGLLNACGATYLTGGISSLKTIPSHKVDFVWSHAVLEHIQRNEFFDTLKELRRIVRPGGVCSHRIDLKDHLGGALNSLRFGKKFWESEYITESGFYTNRLRFSEMLGVFEQVGFTVDLQKVERFESLPTPRLKMAQDFRDISDDELMISGFDVLLY